MGCDIHFHTELKINRRWHHYTEPNILRNYALFSLLADVRNDGRITPLSQPRGLPDDLSILTLKEYEGWAMDAHSMSYIDDPGEMKQVLEFYENQLRQWGYKQGDENPFVSAEHQCFGYMMGHSWYRDREGWPKWVRGARWVFWFDN